MLGDLTSIVFEGLTWGMATFLVAAGLTLVFGILHILNFSHGAFFMVGAYVAFTLISRLAGDVSVWEYVAIALAAALAVDGAAKLVWGLSPQSVSPPDALGGAVMLGDAVIPSYDLFVILCGVAVFAGLDLLIHRTGFGQLVQAVGMDPWTARLLGVNVGAIYTITLMIGFGLAGLAGGLLVANQSVETGMGDIVIIQAFGVIIVGGTGSVRGAFFAAILLGVVQAFGNAYVPSYPGIFFFIGLGAMLLIRPGGLAGREAVA